MKIIIGCISTFLYLNTMWIISEFFLVRKKEDNEFIKWMLLLLISYWFSMDVSSDLHKFIIFLGFLFMVFLLLFIYFEGKVIEIILLIIFEILSISNMYLLGRSLLITTVNTLNMSISNELVEIVVGSFILYLVVAIRKKIIKNIYYVGNKIDIKYLIFFSILTVVDGFLITAMDQLIRDQVSMKRKVVFEISYIILVVGMFVQIGLMIALIISRNVYREKEYLAAKYLEEQKLHYEYLENRELQTKKFRHDIRNHIFIFRELIQKREYEKCEAYFGDLSAEIDQFSSKISVNNGIVDAILNRFCVEAEKKNVELKVKGHMPSVCNISVFDLCTIVSNLLSNAIKAESESQGNVVEVAFRYTDVDIMIAVENDYENELKEENGVYFTTKSDTMNHGFGLQNVEACVEKNNGQMRIDTQDHKFKVMICLNNGD